MIDTDGVQESKSVRCNDAELNSNPLYFISIVVSPRERLIILGQYFLANIFE